MTAVDHPGLLDAIAAFFAAEREARPGQVYPDPCDRTEPATEAETTRDGNPRHLHPADPDPWAFLDPEAEP